MGERGENDVEILVHITAPSTGKDDALYRTLTTTYLDFEWVNNVDLGEETEDEHRYVSDEEAEGQLQAELIGAPADNIWSRGVDPSIENEADACESSQSGSQSLPGRDYFIRYALKNGPPPTSPALSFNSVLDNADSPMLTRHPRSEEGSLSDQGPSWNTPPSVVEDSQSPYNREIPEFSSPTTVLEQWLYRYEACKSQQTPRVICGGGQETPLDKILISPLDTSIIIQTPVPTLTVADTDINLFSPTREHVRQRLLSETRKKKRAITPEETSKSKKRHISIPARIPQNPTAQPSPRTSSDRNASDSSPSKRRVISTQRKVARRQLIDIFPNEIHPPLPSATFNRQFPKRIPLAGISRKLQPQYGRTQTRPLPDPFERGYWSVSMKDWKPKVRARMWKALGIYIRKGHAGWGVWCLRCEEGGEDGCEESDSKVRRKGVNMDYKSDKRRAAGKPVRAGEEPGDRGDRSEGDEDQPAPTHLRCYCWAESRDRIWLLLYLASLKQIKKSKARWIDGNGKTVILRE